MVAHKSSVLLDSNLLLVLIVGAVSPLELRRNRRTRQYSLEDLQILTAAVDTYSQIVVTPHVLTEVSNLLTILSGKYRTQARRILANNINIWEERTTPSTAVVRDRAYERLGLTDAAIATLVGTDTEVLTADHGLCNELLYRGVTAHNFHHFRSTLSFD